MRLPKIAIQNYQFTLVMVLLLTLMGVVSLLTMPRAEDPAVKFPGTNVIAVYPGATPSDLEQLVVDPIEEAINELEDIVRLESVMQDGLALVSVEFIYGSDADEKYDKVVESLNSIRGDLPSDLVRLEALKISPQDVNILQIALVSEAAPYRTLQRQAERLEKTMERVNGVKAVETWAFPEEEVRVSLDLEKMRETNVTLGQVLSAIQSSSANIPGGNVDAGTRRFNIRTSGDYESLDDIRKTVIRANGSRIIYLRDVAEVDFNYEDEAHKARFNGDRAVFVTATQRSGTNIFDVTEALNTRLADFEAQLPPDIELAYVFDQSTSVAFRVNGFFNNLLQGLILVGLIALLALGVRASAIVVLAIPISILMALGWTDFSSIALQQMSIVGLVIALGLLVDNAIVVTENVSRFMQKGETGVIAAIKGTSQIGWAIVSSTATTILAFVPMVMLQTGAGDFIRSMPITVIYTLIASLLVSLTLTPFLASRFLQGKKRRVNAQPKRPRFFQRVLQRVVEGPYRRSLNVALRRPAVVLISALAIFLGSFALFPVVGVSLFPKAEKPLLLININTPEGSSLDKTDEVTRYVESVLETQPAVATYASNIGRGNPRVYYNVFPKNETPTHAQLLVALNDNNPTAINEAVKALRTALWDYPGAEIDVKEFMQGPPLESPIEFRIVGDNLDVIRDLAAQVETIVQQTPGTVNIDNESSRLKTDLHVNINRDKAGLLGVPLIEVDQTVRASIAGLPIASYRDQDGEDHNIVVRLPIENRPTVSDFDAISVASVTGARIPLRQLADLEFETGSAIIEHYNLERTAIVTADALDDYNIAELTQTIIAELDQINWPRGYRYIVGGEQESREESFGGVGQALLIALLGIFGVLVLQFRSFAQPVIVFAAIPFAMTGAILALLFTGYSFSFMAFIGLTSLVGIVVNNSIILVDYANQLLAKGHSVIEAIREASETRFTPILLTTLTTIGGLLPLTLENSSLWSPMGWAIIGGLVVSTFLTLIVVPVLYRLLTRVDTAAATA